MSSSQWSRMLKNAGIWNGSFTQFSADGKLIKDTPSILKLEKLNNDQTLRLTVDRWQGKKPPYIMDFSSLNRNIYLFESGHFAKGSIQYSPVSTFGTEFGFVLGDRRLRTVELYDNQGKLEEIVLIREFRENTNATENVPLSIDQLIGEWEGETITINPDWSESKPLTTNLKIHREDNTIIQSLKTPQLEVNSKATINDSGLIFSENNNSIQVLLLPDGASTTTPLKINLGKPFFVETGWLINSHQRLRLIRQYDEKGGWMNASLVKEFKKR